MIGERGITLSGGQRQRVAIARALVVDPRILILDDATASVDATTESKIRDGLREAMRGRTTIIIAHRLSTIALADEVVVLDDGRVVARGAHDELVETSEVYREIHDHGLLERVSRRKPYEGAPARRAPDARRAACGRGLVVGADAPPAARALHARASVQGPHAARDHLAARRDRRRARAAVSRRPRGRRGAARRDSAARQARRRLRRRRPARDRVHATRRRTSRAGRASGCWPTCAAISSATCSASRSASTSATAPA